MASTALPSIRASESSSFHTKTSGYQPKARYTALTRETPIHGTRVRSDTLRTSKESDSATGRPYSLRYIGSLVADFHRNLLYGGIFLYPADYKDPKKPKAKLRLLYEANPLAFIVEQAGGMASTGKERILDIQATELHQKCRLLSGAKRT